MLLQRKKEVKQSLTLPTIVTYNKLRCLAFLFFLICFCFVVVVVVFLLTSLPNISRRLHNMAATQKDSNYQIQKFDWLLRGLPSYIRVFVGTSNDAISRFHFADYVCEMHQIECPTYSRIILLVEPILLYLERDFCYYRRPF